MPNGLRNWNYRDVIKFLRAHNFVFSHEKDGSHEAWISEDGTHVVEVNIPHKGKSYCIRTLETMIRQSGIEKEEWKEWAKGG